MNWQNWGHVGADLAKTGYYHAAEIAFRKALPEAENLYNLANVLRHLCKYEEAEVVAKRAQALHPGAQETIALLGLLRLDQGDAEAACELLAKTTHISGYYRFCYALALLHAGRYEDGFREYDGRLTANNMPLPMWTGETLHGRTLCIMAEQGFGDTIMYSRFLRLLPPDTKHFFLVPNALVRLIPNAQSSNISFQADFMVPLMSLPARLGVKELPPFEPYISPPVRYHVPKPVDVKLNVGVIWRSKAGGIMRKFDEVRHGEQKSVPLQALLTLMDLEGCKFYALQAGEDMSGDIARLGAGPLIENLGYRAMDFADLAGFMSEMDVIVTCDTGPAHLAGAMGKPTILMLNKAGSWQWGSGSRSPWYPSPDFKMVRQNDAGDWGPVVATVRELLQEMWAKK